MSFFADVQVSVEVRHVPEYSTAHKQAFQYVVTILNRSEDTWQLLLRHWEIKDATGQETMVDGEGVVGEQPFLPPGASYTYDSFVTVEALPATMQGYYALQDAWGRQERAEIPMFVLSVGERVLN